MDCSTPGLPVHHQLPEFTQTHVHWVGDTIQPFHPLSSPSPAYNLPQHQGLFRESVLHIRWPQYWSFRFSISLSNEHSRLISFRMDWLDLLAIQMDSQEFLQHHSLKASALRCSALFMIQLLHPYMTTGKSIVLTIQTLVSKVMCLLFNTLSRFVTAFLPRLQSPSTVILDPKEINVVTVSTLSLSICHEMMGPDAMILVFWMLGFQASFFNLLFHCHQQVL